MVMGGSLQKIQVENEADTLIETFKVTNVTVYFADLAFNKCTDFYDTISDIIY